MPTLLVSELRELLGDIDIYLLDQILKGRIRSTDRILDAGCGGGRNISYLLHLTPSVFGIDKNDEAIGSVRRLAERLQPSANPDLLLPNVVARRDDFGSSRSNAGFAGSARARQFRVESIEANSFAPDSFDVVIANAVLHFARDSSQFERMLAALVRVLTPGGLLFARLASSIGIATQIGYDGPGRYRLPDGSDRYLVAESDLVAATANYGLELVEPLKTVNVQGLRCMTTWVARKLERTGA